MNQIRINIKEVIGTSNASIQKFGNQIFVNASIILKNNASVILDFNGIVSLTSGFCNASIGQLYSFFGELAEKNILIENIDTSSIWYEKIQDAIELAKNPAKAKIIDDAILALFE